MNRSSASLYACQVTACGKAFHTLRGLLSHMELQHSINKQLGITCGIDGCNNFFNATSSFRGHVRHRHPIHWDSSNFSTSSATPTNDYDVEMDLCELDENSSRLSSPNSDHESWNCFLNEFAERLTFFRLKVTEAHSLPVSVVGSIFQDVQSMFDLFQQQFCESIKGRLQHLGVNWNEDMLLREMFSQGSFFERCSSKFSTEHLFSAYLEKQFELNVPISQKINSSKNVGGLEGLQNIPNISVPNNCEQDDIGSEQSATLLNTNVCQTDAFAQSNVPPVGDVELLKTQDDVYTFHYVPILKTLKTYLEQPDVWASCNQVQVDDGLLRDFRDGIIWKNCVHKDNKMFLRIHLYSDELELCNPLGNKRNHKLSAFYFLVGNLETKYWSSLTNIHLALLCNYDIVKRFGYDEVLKPLLDDIKRLESDGISIELDGQQYHVFGSVVTFTGDNLSSHALGGFNTCFSSGRICRQCMAPKVSIVDILSEADCDLRTESGHNYHVNAVSSDPSLSSVYGVKGASPFCGLSWFNPVTFFPADLMHDVTEGSGFFIANRVEIYGEPRE